MSAVHARSLYSPRFGKPNELNLSVVIPAERSESRNPGDQKMPRQPLGSGFRRQRSLSACVAARERAGCGKDPHRTGGQ